MKKLNNKGFVLAETLIVTVFILAIFTMIYTYYYPTIGLYEERETYDDVDGKYVAYWIKQLIESDSYNFNNDENTKRIREYQMKQLGYIRFQCDDVTENDNRRKICKNLVNALEISKCDAAGNNCDIFITHYQIGTSSSKQIHPNFKQTVNGAYPDSSSNLKENVLKRYQEETLTVAEDGIDLFCPYAENDSQVQKCKNKYMRSCYIGKGYQILADGIKPDGTIDVDAEMLSQKSSMDVIEYCNKQAENKIFPSYLADYINFLPDYTASNYNTGAKYRVIIVVQHKKALNNYYSFSTIEVNK